jgi:hypothetical protein
MSCKPIFPVDVFLAEFPEFGAPHYTKAQVARCGKAATKYITEWECGFPLSDPDDRAYALFLMAAHILALRKASADDITGGNTPMGGRVRKAVVGAVTIETDSPNAYTTDDYKYWLNQTSYGQELLAYLNNAAPVGIYMNTRKDSVRVL